MLTLPKCLHLLLLVVCVEASDSSDDAVLLQASNRAKTIADRPIPNPEWTAARVDGIAGRAKTMAGRPIPVPWKADGSLKYLMADPGGLDSFVTQIRDLQGDEVMGKQFLNSVGAVMLILNGFEWKDWDKNGWGARNTTLKASDEKSWDRISTTWKGGSVDYSPDATGSNALQKMDIGFTGTSVGELAQFLEDTFNISPDDYDRAQVEMMFSWSLTPDSPWVPVAPFDDETTHPTVFLGFSWGGATDCSGASPDECKLPGRANEMIAASCLQYLQAHTDAHLVSQWEIVTAVEKLMKESDKKGKRHERKMKKLRKRLHSVGGPGSYLTGTEVMAMELEIVSNLTNASDDEKPHVAVISHPDFLTRSYKTAKTAFQKAIANGQEGLEKVALIPAMFPFDLEWPARSERLFNAFRSGNQQLLNGDAFSWYGAESDEQKNYDGLGYFTNNPQSWLHERRTWLLYELWARAKVYSIKGMVPPDRWSDLPLSLAQTPLHSQDILLQLDE